MASWTGATWNHPTVGDGRVRALAASTGLSLAAARVLAVRWDGSDMPDPADWLAPSLQHLHDPHQMLNMASALDRLEHAIKHGQRLRIITDYDVDGTTSSLILQAALRLRNPALDISYHIPNRFAEGYGFSVIAAQKAVDDKIDLIVTADIGVRDHAAVEVARKGGVDVLICDHHLPPGESVPENAIVLCPPQVGCDYPNSKLAACGVSLKLAQALLQRSHSKWPLILQSLLKLGAVGTVADLVPLTTLENRAIVALGLRELNQGKHHPGLLSLLNVCDLKAGTVRESDLGYRIGPRINAAGRVDDAKLVVELLNCRDPERAGLLAKNLDELNTKRRSIQKDLTKDALAQLEGGDVPGFVVLAGEEAKGWHRGVVGIVASRVKDEVSRPTAIVSIQGDRAVGSVRSVPAIHAVKALDSVRDLLVKYGGHPAAAGFTVPTKDLDELKERLAAFVDEHADDADLCPVYDVDAEVTFESLNPRLLQEFQRLAPFGMGHPEPLLCVRSVKARWVDVKADGRLLKLGWPAPIEAIWWDHGDDAHRFKGQSVDVLARLKENVWNGRSKLQLQIVDAADPVP